jgi:hypothetical protein
MIIELMGPYVYLFWTDEGTASLHAILETHVKHEQALITRIEVSGLVFLPIESGQFNGEMISVEKKKDLENEWKSMLSKIRWELRSRFFDLSIPPAWRNLFRTQYFDLLRVYGEQNNLISITIADDTL